MPDFVEKEEWIENDEETENEDENEGAFFEPEPPKNSVSQRNTTHNHNPVTKAGAGITIDTSSIEKLIHSFDFSAMAIEQAMLKVSQNRDIGAILDELSKIRTMDISKFNTKVEEAITKFDLSKIERKIDQKFDQNLAKNFKTIENAANKYEKWGKVFEDPEALDTLDKVERIEKFAKNFKVRSIFFSCIFGFLASFFLTYFATQFFFEPQNSQPKANTNSDLSVFFAKIGDHKIAENDKVIQLQIPISNSKIQIGQDSKIKFIQIQK